MAEKNKPSKAKVSSKPKSHFGRIFGAFITLFIAILIGIYVRSNFNSPPLKCDSSQLTFWPIPLTIENDDLQTVRQAFKHVGYRQVDGNDNDWDVIWTSDFVFEKFSEKVEILKPHQIINHFPGITFLTNKKHLGVSTYLKYIPVTFDFPRLKNEFLYYKKTEFDKQFVVKNYNSGGIQVVDFEDTDYFLGDERFMQEFISNPYLIDGHAFDFGVYILITSIDPLRVYKWSDEILFRFCSEPYYPFDSKIIEKYVTQNHKPYWEIPSLAEHTKSYNFSAKEALNFCLKQDSRDVKAFWSQMDIAISTIILAKSTQIARHVDLFRKSHPDLKRGFFELVRFDFIVDNEMNLHLMEVNMSPNLDSSDEGTSHQTFKNLVRNTISILGISTRVELRPESLEENLMISSTKDIAVNPDVCITCLDSCDKNECELCLPCLSNETTSSLHQSYREHYRQGEFKRLFPTEKYAEPKLLQKLSQRNKLSIKWFQAKCQEDSDWC